MNKSSIFNAQSELCLRKMNENSRPNIAWEQRLKWFKSSPEYRTSDKIDGEPTEFEWNIFPGFNTLQLSQEFQELLLRLGETPENFTGRFSFMSMFNDISWGSKDNKIECESNAQLVSLFAKKNLEQDNSHFSDWAQVKSGILSVQILAEKMMVTSQKADNKSSEPRVHCPEVSSRAKAVENCRSTIVPTRRRLQLFSAHFL